MKIIFHSEIFPNTCIKSNKNLKIMTNTCVVHVLLSIQNPCDQRAQRSYVHKVYMYIEIV